MDIADFIRARLDEDEAAAKGVHVIDKASWHVLEWYDGQFEGGKTARVDLRSSTGSITDRGSLPRPVGAHIARHDPARVLAEVAAKRRILERHDSYDFRHDPDDGPGDYSWTGRCDGCFEDYPCSTARDLAAPYAEHPDYDPAWKPGED